MRSGHANVRDISRALRKNAFIGRGHVRVRADDRGHPPVQVPAHREFFTGGFRVHVDQNEGDIGGYFREFAVRLTERIVDRRQKHSPLQIQHGIFHAVFRGAHIKPAARVTFGKICRPQQPRLVRQEFQNLFAIPAVVSASEHIDPHFQKLFRKARRDSEPRRRILPIGDHQVDVPLRDDVREAILNDLPSG